MRAVSATAVSVGHLPLSSSLMLLDGFHVAEDFLLLGGHVRGGERNGMGLEGFRKRRR
jgi:hypothetical protein